MLIFSYLWDTQSPKVAREYAEAIEDKLNKAEGLAKANEFLDKLRDENGNIDANAWNGILSGGKGFGDGVLTFFDGLGNLFNSEGMMSVTQYEQMYILNANEVIKACAICNHLSNEEYANVSWRIKDTGQNVCIIHALAVGYDYRGQGLGKILVNQIISDAKESGSEAIHLDVIDNNVAAEAFYKGLGFQYISTENIFYEVVGHRNFRMYEYILRE